MRHTHKIILASSSPRRQELLSSLRVPFETYASNVDEHIKETVSPAKFVELVAERKASHVASRLQSGSRETAHLVIGSDTVVVLHDEILGKPANAEDAFHMLSKLQGQSHFVYTGLCVLDTQSGRTKTGHSKTKVTMKSLPPDAIHRYIETGEPLDKAGAYAIQGLGATLVTEIEGDYFTVVGLPITLLADYLCEFDYPVL